MDRHPVSTAAKAGFESASVSTRYDRRACHFGNDYRSARYHSAASLQQRKNAVRQFYSGLKKAAFLDAGCGTGFYTSELTADNTVIGVDVSTEMLRLCSLNGLVPVQGDLRHLPFVKDSFDEVLAAEVLQHFRWPEPILSEIVSVTRPGGQIVVTSLNPHSFFHALYRPFGNYEDLFFHAPDKVVEFLQRAGCVEPKVFFLMYPFGLVWRQPESRHWASFLGTSWVLSVKKQLV